MNSANILMDGVWITYKPLDGIDPTFTPSQLHICAALYAQAISQGKTELEAHSIAEAYVFKLISTN